MAALRRRISMARSTPTHGLIKHLKERGRLLRCYTQNIDGLESQEGLLIGELGGIPIQSADVIQLHGDINSLKCMACCSKYPWTIEREDQLDKGIAPICPNCHEIQEKRTSAGKRFTGVGCLRPNIVLYGEEHSEGEAIGQCTSKDIKSKPDFLIISGTSLKVIGIRKVVRNMAKTVKERGGLVIFVNMTELGQSMWNDIIDYYIEGESDSWVADLKNQIPEFFKLQTKISGVSVKNGFGDSIKENIALSHKQVPTIPTFSIPSPPSTPRKKRPSESNSSPSSPSKLRKFSSSISQPSPQPHTPSTPHILRTPRTKRIQQGNLSFDVILQSENREPLTSISVNRISPRRSPRRIKPVETR